MKKDNENVTNIFVRRRCVREGGMSDNHEKTKRKNLEFIDYCVGYTVLCRKEIAPLKTIRIIERPEKKRQQEETEKKGIGSIFPIVNVLVLCVPKKITLIFFSYNRAAKYNAYYSILTGFTHKKQGFYDRWNLRKP
jgi:hypothetical protein